jgi:excisionase family DNA binding protein
MKAGAVAVNVFDTTEVLTVEEAGKVLGLGRSAAYAAARRGDIPSLRLGRRIVVPKARLRKMLGLRHDVVA